MKKIKKILVLLVALILMPHTAHAASGSISVSGSSTVVQGNKITVNVTLSSSTPIGSWQMDLNYDKNYLQLVSSSAEAGGTMMAGYSASGTKSKTYTFSFKAKKKGNTIISVGSYLAYAYSDISELSLKSSSKTIKIMTQQELEATYSKDNYLKSIEVEGYNLEPAFNKDTLDYKINVPTGTTKVTISAKVNDAKSSVSGDGEIEVSEGLNTVPLVVTAQNGSERTYNLTINVEDQNPIKIEVDNKDYTVVKNAALLTTPTTFRDTTVTINDVQIPAFINENAKITLVGLKDEDGTIDLFKYENGKYSSYKELTLNSDILIPTPFTNPLDLIKTTVTLNNEKYDAYKYSENSNFVIINATNLADGKTDLYLYDTINKTAQLYDETYINDTKETIKNYTYIIITFAGALVVMIIIIFSLLHSLKRKQKKLNKFLQKQEAKIEATRKLNDVVDEVKKITEAENKVKNKKKKTADDKKENTEIKKEDNKPEIEVKEIKVENNKITEVSEDTEEIYDLFADDKKKNKKKKK